MEYATDAFQDIYPMCNNSNDNVPNFQRFSFMFGGKACISENESCTLYVQSF